MKKKSEKNTARAAQISSCYPLLKICLIFFGVILAFNLVEWLALKPSQIEPLQIFTAKTTSGLINLSGIETRLQGTHVFFERVHWEIVAECTALQAMYVFLAFVIAYPSSLKSKAIGIFAGLPFLITMNILRLFVLAWANHFFPNYAELVHDYVWQIAFLFLLILMWLLWIDLVVKREKIPVLPA
jgi:archaeosortase B (VPXXXP-CTERM-specific)